VILFNQEENQQYQSLRDFMKNQRLNSNLNTKVEELKILNELKECTF